MSKTITVQPSGHQFTVEDDEPILEGALRSGLAFPYSCRDGACGTCKNKLLQGRVHYPDGTLPPALTEQEHQKGLQLFCQARALSDCTIEVEEISAMEDIPVKTLPCRVAKLEKLTHDVMGVFLTLPKNEHLRFLAGQYIDIIMRDGRRRSFSIANAPHDDEMLELHIRHVQGGAFSDFVFEGLQEKAILRFKGPLGSFFLREDSDKPVIFMAGGTGFAPVKGIIDHAIHIGMRRTMHLYWGVRSKRDLYMPQVVQQWQQDGHIDKFIPVLSEPQPEDEWQGRTGYVTESIAEDFKDLSDFEIYAGGPPQMILSGRALFYPLGLSEKRYYYDSFEYAKE